MSSFRFVANNLAAAFLSGSWERASLLRQAKQACGRDGRTLSSLIRRLLTSFPAKPHERTLPELAAFVESDELVRAARASDRAEMWLRRIYWVPPSMSPASGSPATWNVPTLTTLGALSDWLGVKPAELDWLADCHGREAMAATEALRHYRYRLLPKRSSQWRLLEIPKPRLKAIQRRILHEIVDRIPPHDAAHGYRSQRSIATFAAPHCGKRVVLRFDLKGFFPSIRASRIHAIFSTAGYPESVARLLTGLCTNVVPDAVFRDVRILDPASQAWDWQQPYRHAHLGQGAPTSPALANLAAYRFDCRMHGLAKSIGANYTRYADDLAFSGNRDLERSIRRLRVLVCLIALEEGFEINLRKSRVMREGVRQQLVGIVVNAHLNRPREHFDRLKAILHNCVRLGPAAQNRESRRDFRAYLLGCIAHWRMINPVRGQKLHDLFDQITWPATPQCSSAS
jgi:retron-type reverse transcriptase